MWPQIAKRIIYRDRAVFPISAGPSWGLRLVAAVGIFMAACLVLVLFALHHQFIVRLNHIACKEHSLQLSVNHFFENVVDIIEKFDFDKKITKLDHNGIHYNMI